LTTAAGLTPFGGISKITIQSRPTPAGLLKFGVKGKRASLPPEPGNPPLTTILVLDSPAATTGQCGEAVLTCTFNGSGSSRRCR
jgi:hypothetical protein